MDRLASDEVRQRLSDDSGGLVIAEHGDIGANRFDLPVGADQKQQRTRLDRIHCLPNTRSKIVSTRFRWYPRSKSSSSWPASSLAVTSGSALSRSSSESWPSDSHTFIALRWTR